MREQGSGQGQGSGLILLDVPAVVDHLQFLRVAVATAAAGAFADIRRVDDTRLVVDELVVATLRAVAPGSRLRVEVEVEPGRVRIEGTTRATDSEPRLSDVGAILLESICHEYSLGRHADMLRFRMVIVGPPPVGPPGSG
jgi:hypothetical protein